jgi:hypothetical protein
MSDNRFDAAIKSLHKARDKARIDDPCPICQIDEAIIVLESWPRWEKLISAAGKVDKLAIIKTMEETTYRPLDCRKTSPGIIGDCLMQIRALLAAIPDEKEEGK